MAQLAEQLICNQQVVGSSPSIGFIKVLSGRVLPDKAFFVPYR